MNTVINPDDPRLADLLSTTHKRFSQLVAEAEIKARPFYEQLFGEPLSLQQTLDLVFGEVEHDGDAGVARFNRLFDRCTLPADQLTIGRPAMLVAWNTSSLELKQALSLAANQIKTYQQRLLPTDFGLNGGLGARWLPVQRVGSYVPGGAGGSLPLCSSVLMNLIPAQVAGVPELVLATPPRADGSVAPEILAAAHLAGVDQVYLAGGMQAIAAMACGTGSLAAVDKIVGPGNIFVTLAKRQAFGRVDIDMLAGPSEVLVIADDSVDPAWAAADLLSQAEHDALATCLCCAIGDGVADAILSAAQQQLAALPEERRQIATAAMARYGCFVACRNVDEAIDIANRFAPEHLELLVRDAENIIPDIRHAGAIFVGPWSPEPIGDYVAGPSHTLPTCGTARMWSGIGADIFLRRSSVINLSEQEFRRLAPSASVLARAEGLEAHARSVDIRGN